LIGYGGFWGLFEEDDRLKDAKLNGES